MKLGNVISCPHCNKDFVYMPQEKDNLKDQWCECEHNFDAGSVIFVDDVKKMICSNCKNPIKQESKPQPKWKWKLPEEIKPEDVTVCDYGDTDRIVDYILYLTTQYNELRNCILENRQEADKHRQSLKT